jgi:hypothetical protein
MTNNLILYSKYELIIPWDEPQRNVLYVGRDESTSHKFPHEFVRRNPPGSLSFTSYRAADGGFTISPEGMVVILIKDLSHVQHRQMEAEEKQKFSVKLEGVGL